jgi:transcriptional regulator with XRE-family HTH domain
VGLNRRAVGWAFGQVVKKARRAAGYKQTDFAPLAFISTDGLSIIERGGRAPSIAIVFSIAAALGTTPDALVARARRLVAKCPPERLDWRHERKERLCRDGGR